MLLKFFNRGLFKSAHIANIVVAILEYEGEATSTGRAYVPLQMLNSIAAAAPEERGAISAIVQGQVNAASRNQANLGRTVTPTVFVNPHAHKTGLTNGNTNCPDGDCYGTSKSATGGQTAPTSKPKLVVLEVPAAPEPSFANPSPFDIIPVPAAVANKVLTEEEKLETETEAKTYAEAASKKREEAEKKPNLLKVYSELSLKDFLFQFSDNMEGLKQVAVAFDIDYGKSSSINGIGAKVHAALIKLNEETEAEETEEGALDGTADFVAAGELDPSTDSLVQSDILGKTVTELKQAYDKPILVNTLGTFGIQIDEESETFDADYEVALEKLVSDYA